MDAHEHPRTNHKIMKKHTIITGASSGLGKAFAFELASKNKNLILVSLPNENLYQIAHFIEQKYKVDTYIYETDLSQKVSIEAFTEWLLQKNLEVDALINNAGIGGSMAFDQADGDLIDLIIQINVRATAMLTKSIISLLLKNEKSYILNVSSIAAFSPLPYKMVYPATKAFIYSFSMGLNAEFRHKGLRVSVVHPGAMPTNQDILNRIEKQGWLGRIGTTKPDFVAKVAIQKAWSGQSVIVPGLVNRLNYWVFKFIPWAIIEPFVSRTIKRELVISKPKIA